MKIHPDDPAYPVPQDLPIYSGGDRHGWASDYVGKPESGMSIRAAMATQIMAGFAFSPPDELPPTANQVAELAVEWADALIDALNAGGGQ